jgi:hypothetical protein
MTNSRRTSSTRRHDIRTAPRRRRLTAALLVSALALGGSASALLGVISSPGRIGGGTRQSEVAIPGVRGTGGGTGAYYGISTSPGRTELALPRKAGGVTLDYL